MDKITTCRQNTPTFNTNGTEKVRAEVERFEGMLTTGKTYSDYNYYDNDAPPLRKNHSHLFTIRTVHACTRSNHT